MAIGTGTLRSLNFIFLVSGAGRVSVGFISVAVEVPALPVPLAVFSILIGLGELANKSSKFC